MLRHLPPMPAVSIATEVVTSGPIHEIQLRHAKATLSAMIDNARQGQRLLMAAPLGGGDLPARDASPVREVDL